MAEPLQSTVVPMLLAALVCDVAVADPSSGKRNLIGIFDNINAGKLPTTRPMSVYLKLADAEGLYKIEVRFVKVRDGELLAGAACELQVPSRLQSSDFHLQFPPLPFPEAGRYEFQIWCNSMFLGSASLQVVLRSSG